MSLTTLLNWEGCQLVHLKIHIMLLFLKFDNSIISKSGIKEPISWFCMFCSLRYQLFGISIVTFTYCILA